jgi:hypothetical protein
MPQSDIIAMQTETINPDCEIEQLLFLMKFNGIRPNSNHGRILLWLEKRGPGDYSITDIAKAMGLSVRRTRLAIIFHLLCNKCHKIKIQVQHLN